MKHYRIIEHEYKNKEKRYKLEFTYKESGGTGMYWHVRWFKWLWLCKLTKWDLQLKSKKFNKKIDGFSEVKTREIK